MTWIAKPSHQLMPYQVFVSFSLADDLDDVAVDEQFAGTWAGVVVAAHGGAVGSGTERAQKFAACDGRQVAVFGEKVSRFTDGADDIRFLALGEFPFNVFRHGDVGADRPNAV